MIIHDRPAAMQAATHAPIVWPDPAREQAFGAWLQATAPDHALDVASLRLASADASFRRYFRIDAHPASCIIMDAPPDKEDCQPFVKVAGLMAEAGLPAPRVLAWDAASGFMLLSDLGAQTMMEVIAPPVAVDAVAQANQTHYELYVQAIDTLVRWQLSSKPGVLPPYDDALLSRELALFPDWYVAQHRSFALTTAQQTVLDDAFKHIKASNLQSLGGAQVFVHRDYMARNLMVNVAPTLVASRTSLPPAGAHFPRGGPSENIRSSPPAAYGLGILDFQDAVYGPITYDIASLMRDAFLTWEEDFVLDITVRYWQQARKAGLPVGDDFGEFYRAVEWMGLQRHLKILGIFARLTLRDGKPKYLADTPRFIKYVRATAARYRQLGPLMVLLDAIEGNETRVGYTF
jgi:aminoglycoside/choline kinase family phosphotransferase